MRHHASYGLGFESLDVVIVEDSKVMQSILRSVFNSLKVARLRVFGDGSQALAAMLVEPPNLIVTDWNMKPMSGHRLLKSIRSAGMGPLCRVPAMVVTAHATRAMVDKAMRVGAHHVVAKPFSPATLVARLESLLADERPMILDATRQTWGIQGVDQLIAANFAKLRALDTAHQFQETVAKRAKTLQVRVDRILADATIAPERPAAAPDPAKPASPRLPGMDGKFTRPAKRAPAADPAATQALDRPKGFAKLFKARLSLTEGSDTQPPRQPGQRAA